MTIPADDLAERIAAVLRQEDMTLLRAEDVADRLKLGRSKVYAMMQNGELPVVRIGRSVRVPSGALTEWITAQQR